MEQVHLKQGEIGRLYSYLMYKFESGVSDEELIAAAGADISAVIEFISNNAYESSSTFGKTKEGIVSNSKKHFSSCGKCFKEYEEHVKSIAIILKLAYAKLSQRIPSTQRMSGIEERLSAENRVPDYIMELDYLGVLNRLKPH